MWLVNNLGLSKVPRLITPHVEPQPQPTRHVEVFDNEMSRQKSVDASSVLQADFDLDSFSHQGAPPGKTRENGDMDIDDSSEEEEDGNDEEAARVVCRVTECLLEPDTDSALDP